MNLQICKVCKKDSKIGIDVLGMHLCSDCLHTIEDLEIGEENYDYYKDALKENLKACIMY